jgi:glyoxylase-like metal-dependent hydrolase (beta-lactamase superfamily II)
MPSAGQLAYVARDTKTYKPARAALRFRTVKDKVAMLWGDPVYVIGITNGTATVSARGHYLEMPVGDLMDTPLLSVFQIDVGQGDGALVHLPDNRWLMVDGGPPKRSSNSGKIASDFVDWKMFVDQSWRKEFSFGGPRFVLDSVVCTHPDEDHYGGLEAMTKRVRSGILEYGNVFHCGLARYAGQATAYANGRGFGQLGEVEGNAVPDAYVTSILDDFDDVRELAAATAARPWKLNDRTTGRERAGSLTRATRPRVPRRSPRSAPCPVLRRTAEAKCGCGRAHSSQSRDPRSRRGCR